MNEFDAPSQSFGIAPLQKLQLSLTMRQSLDVLQMPIEELSTWLEGQIEQNPVLDWKESSYKKSVPLLSMEIPYEPSLLEELMQQARELFYDPLSLEQMEWIIGNLEPTGFFTTSFDVAPLSWDRKRLAFLLRQLQKFDPPGIGARNLQESLLLQLRSLGKEKQLCYLIVEEHLDEILDGKILSVQKKCQTDEKTLHQAIYSDIASLDPFPGLRFQKTPTCFVTPDVFFVEEEGAWHLEINEERIPEYNIRSYSSEPFLSSEDRTFCKRYISQAHSMGLMIEKRKKTLHKVSSYLVKKQIDYLREESSSLIPLTISEIASELQMHESTIARAINNKYLACRWGTIQLKSLLSKSVNKHAEEVSSDEAHKLLQKLIAEENKKAPLSDREILEKMRTIGVPCARRTVTKYRKSLNIPSRRFRRRKLGSV